MFWIYCIIFVVVTAFMLWKTADNRSFPGITAIGCFAIGFLWPVLLPIFLVGLVICSILEAIDCL